VPTSVLPPTAQVAESAPAQSEPAATPPEPLPLDMAAVQRLNEHWKDFLGMVRKQHGVRVEAALRGVQDIAIAQDSVAFAFGTNDFTRSMIAEPETNGKIVLLLSKVLGRSVKLECQLGERAQLTNMITLTSNSTERDGVDPLLEYALSTLGAEVIESVASNK